MTTQPAEPIPQQDWKRNKARPVISGERIRRTLRRPAASIVKKAWTPMEQTKRDNTPGGFIAPSWVRQGGTVPEKLPEGWSYQPGPEGQYPAGKQYLTRWTPPDYTPTYWEQPENVSRWYKQYKAGQAPDWVDGPKIEQAYEYLKFANNGLADTAWRYLPPTDPGREFLQQIGPPPLEATVPKKQYQEMVMADLLQREPGTWTAEDLGKLDPTNRSQVEGYLQAYKETKPIGEIPYWQQGYIDLSSNPLAMGAAQMGGLGFFGGLAGGPVGAAAGAVGGTAVGAAIGGLSSLPAGSWLGELARGAMTVLDLPYQGLERSYGTLMQYWNFPDNPYIGTDLDRVLAELKAAWQASGVTAEVGAALPQEISIYNPVTYYASEQVMKSLGYDGSFEQAVGKGGRFDLLNVASIGEWAIRKGLSEIGFSELDPGKIQVAGLNEAFVLETIETPQGTRVFSQPVNVGYTGMAALIDARRRILSGEDPQYVQDELKFRFGVSGAVTDLAYGIVFDPLNILPGVGTQLTGKALSSLGYTRLGGALERVPVTEGIRAGLKNYQIELRNTALVEGVNGLPNLNWMQRLLGGLTQEGTLAELRDTAKLGVMQNLWAKVSDLTDSSKARIQMAMGTENFANLLLSSMSNPDELLRRFEVIATQRPWEAAKIAEGFGSPEMYTLQRQLAGFAGTVRQDVALWKSGTDARARLSEVAQAVGMRESELVRIFEEVDSPAEIQKLLAQKARQVTEAQIAPPGQAPAEVTGPMQRQLRKLGLPEAFIRRLDAERAWQILGGESGARSLTAESQALAARFLDEIAKGGKDESFFKSLQEVFTGKDPAPYAPEKLAANLFAKFEDYSGNYLSQMYRLAPDHAVMRFANVMKKAQSFLLLGLNPAYLFNNAFDNMEKRALSGVFGFATEARIQRYFDEVGTSPYRLEAGVGAAGVLPEEEILTTHGGEALHQTGAGEVHIRQATTGKLGMVEKGLDTIGKIGVVSEWSRKVESGESRQAMYFAHKKDWGSRWRRNVGFRLIDDPELMSSLRAIDPLLPDAVYSMVEGARNEKQLDENLNRILKGAERNYLLDYYLPGLAKDLGMDGALVKDSLGPFMDDLRDGLMKARTPDDVAKVFAGLERQAQEHADELTAAQLKGMAEHIKNTAQAEGWAGAIKLFNDVAYENYEYAIKNAMRWQDTFDLAQEMRDGGASEDAVHGMFKQRGFFASQDAQRLSAMNAAAYKGILEAWGAGSDEVTRFSDHVAAQNKLYGDYYTYAQTRRNQVFDQMKGLTKTEMATLWNELEVELQDEFERVQKSANDISLAIDGIHVDVIARQFGDQAGLTAIDWRSRLHDLEYMRQQSMEQQRKINLAQHADERRAAWPKYYNEEYLPMLREHYNQQTTAIQEMYASLTGRQAPPAEPSIAPQPPPITPKPGAPPAPSPDILRENFLDLAHEYGMPRMYEAGKNQGKDISLTSRMIHAKAVVKKYGGTDVLNMADGEIYALPEERLRDIFQRHQVDVAEKAAAAARLREAELGTPKAKLVNGTIDEAEPWIAAIFKAEAQKMLAELDTYTPNPLVEEPDRVGKFEKRLSGGGTQTRWYREMPGYPKITRKDIVKALERIVSGNGEDIPKGKMALLPYFKEEIYGRLVGGYTDELGIDIPPNIGFLMWLGDEERALKIYADYLEGGVIPDDAMVGTPEYRQRLVDLYMVQPLPELAEPSTPRIEEVAAARQQAEEVIREFIGAHGGESAGRAEAKPDNLFQKMPPPPAVGRVPPGGTDELGSPEWSGKHEGDIWLAHVSPILTALQAQIARTGPVAGRDIPPSIADKIAVYKNKLMGDMATSRIASIRYAEQTRDFAMLNYSRRRGFDNMLGLVYPYQYWYTRSMFNWAQRFFDKPSLLAHWARLRSLQDRTKRQGYPSRLANKVKIAAPFLPEWAGDSVYVDLLRKIFSFEEFLGPIQQMISRRQDLDRQTEWMLQRMINEGTLTEEQARQAVLNKNQAWDDARAAVEADQSNEADYSWVNTIMQPALYLTLPAFLMTGKVPLTGRSDMGLLPMTRTGLGIEAATQDTALEGIGSMIGNVLAGPEMLLRRKNNLDEFGDWGDYKIEKQLANLAAEGEISVRDAQLAMMERSGPAYDLARERVRYEIGITVAPAAFGQSLLKGQAWKDPASFMMASLFGWLPQGLLPEGELKQRGLAEIYKLARTEYNAGNKQALKDFFDKYPEYEARLALFDTPDERLRQFLVSEVYDRYYALDSSLQEQLARQQLGPDFEAFLRKENTNDLDAETLAVWARLLGGQVPKAGAVQAIAETPDIDMAQLQQATPAEAAAVDTYRKLREELFPNWYAWQARYYAFPEGSQQRRDYLAQVPQLKAYWEWSRGYKDQYPAIEKYTQNAEDTSALNYTWLSELDPLTIRQLYTYYALRMPISRSAMEELKEQWEKQGRPGTFETWLDRFVRSGVMP